MRTLARFAVEKRWWVIAAWIAFIVGAQALSGAAGGADYKDVFTLPHTETQKVLDLLRANGQGGQTGQVGTVVVHAETGRLDQQQAPAGLGPALESLCGKNLHVSSPPSARRGVAGNARTARPRPLRPGAGPAATARC